MRNLRKLTAVVVAIALVLTSMTAVLAADAATIANADKAVTLKDLGLYAGQDANDPKVGLENALTTQDSLIFLAKLFGYNDAANALTADQVTEALAKFDDAASISDYAKNVVAYSAANSILSGSTKDGKFFVGAKDTVTAARFASFMLKQMGYSVADYKVSVAKLAETSGSKVDASVTGDLTRDSAIGIMYGALTAEKASGKTVIADIVGDNADLKAKAEKLGLLVTPISPTNPEDIIDGGSSNESSSNSSGSGSGSNGGGSNGGGSQDPGSQPVKVINNKQIEISFNAEMDEASVKNQENYTIKDNGNVEKTLTSTSCKLSDDRKTVIITLDSTVQDCLTNNSTVKVILSKEIKSAQGTKLDVDKVYNVRVEDGLIPTVKEVRHVGEKNIDITFSEPVYEGNNNSKELTPSNFAVKSGTNTYNVTKATLDLDVINLEVETKLIEGPITVTVNNNGLASNSVIQDYAGYKVFKSDHTFNYVKDTSVAVVTVKSAARNEVVLAFSKPIKGKNIKLYHSAKNSIYVAEATTIGFVGEITFTFKEALPSGNLKLYLVNSDTAGDKITDGYDVKVPDQTLTTTVVTDNIAPVVTACEPNKNESIKIVFDEELDENVASNPNSYVVKRLSDNKKIDFEVVLENSRKSVELVFSTKLKDNTEYKLVIKEYKDKSGNKNISYHEFNFTTGDNTPPTVLYDPESEERCFATAEKGEIYIVYSEPMNEAQMLDEANYMVSIEIDKGNPYIALGDDDKITKISDRMVKIYVKALADKNDSTITPSVKIAPIMDLANKRLNGKVDAVEVIKIKPENVFIVKAQLIAKNKIKVVFNSNMDFNQSDIKLVKYIGEITTPSSISVETCDSCITNDDGKTEAYLILNGELTTDGREASGDIVYITTIDTPSSKSKYGSKLISISGSHIALTDMLAPEIVMWDDEENIPMVVGRLDFADPQSTTPSGISITIYFSEDIAERYGDSALTVDTFSVSEFTVTNITAPADSKTVVLTVEAIDEAILDNIYNMTITVTQNEDIYDRAGNASSIPDSPWDVMWAQPPQTN